MPRIKLLYALMISGIIVCLFQIWLPAYFLTGDGPCHVYNAKILHDLWKGDNVAFYNRFFSASYDPNPNWLSQLLIAGFMFLFNGVVSEKLFLSVYALLLIAGFYKVIKHISGSSSYFITIVFIFVFHYSLAKGFYNFTLGIAFFFWMLWAWMRFLDKRDTRNTIVFFLFTALTFFSQLLPFVFGVICCGLLMISDSLAKENAKRPPVYEIIRGELILGILIAPFAALTLWFTNRQGGLGIQLRHHFYRLIELVQFKFGINGRTREELFTSITGFTIMALFICAVGYRIRKKEFIHRYDGLIYSFLVLSFVYIFFPDDFLHRAILITIRTQLFLLALAGMVIAYILPQQVKNAGGLIIFICFICLSAVRGQMMLHAADAVADLNGVIPYIKPNSLVVLFNYAPSGLDRQRHFIGDRNYLFSHALDYTGCRKPVIMMDNYEANTGYFPLLWNYKCNPYVHLWTSRNNETGKPDVDIENYSRVSGASIDNIVLWCPDSSGTHLPPYIIQHYHQVYTSPSGRTILYQAN